MNTKNLPIEFHVIEQIKELLGSRGEFWCRGELRTDGGRRCLWGALKYIRSRRIAAERTGAYLATAIKRAHSEECSEFGEQWTEHVVFSFNDKLARSFADILDLLNAARELVILDWLCGSDHLQRALQPIELTILKKQA